MAEVHPFAPIPAESDYLRRRLTALETDEQTWKRELLSLSGSVDGSKIPRSSYPSDGDSAN